MPYSYINLTQALVQLSERLDDESNVYWSTSELTLYLQEALRFWQGIAGYWRGRMVFNTVSDTPFYDLTAQAKTLIPYTITDTILASEILYHLLEAQLSGSPLAYVGTDMFILDDITQAMQRRRDQFLVETGMVLGVSTIGVGALPTMRIPLADSTIDVRRACLIDASGVKTPLWRTNEFGAQGFSPRWATSPQDPTVGYSIAAEPPVTITLIPPQSLPSELELITLNAGAALNPANGVLLGIPDNFAWVVKFGAMADLLSKAGQAQDLPRASYCGQRWREGIQVARMHTSAVWGAIDGQETFIGTIEGLDGFNPAWETTIGAPSDLALGSWNLLAVPPDTAIHGIRLDVVQNAPVPVNPTDYLQVGREELDVILDYAEHLALFKVGGGEFLDTTNLYDNTLQLAGVYNERLQASVDYSKAMSDRAILEEALRPRRIPVEQQQEA